MVGADEEASCTYYEAVIDDVFKGSNQIGQTIIITQTVIEEAGEKTGEIRVFREYPLMIENDNLILFLKEGNNDTYGIIYYIAGEIQGKFQIKDGKVFSVKDSLINKPYY